MSQVIRGAISAIALPLVAGCGESPFAAAAAQDRPGQLATLPDGRGLNFKCMGRGAPTVLLESGFGAGASGWARVQPLIAKSTRVCAYDRAGYGFSDPAPAPRDGAAIARDLDAGLDAAQIIGPFILVGHSAGGLYGRIFAARRLQEVKGLVLVDPTVEQNAAPGRDGLGGARARLQRCLNLSQQEARLRQADPNWKDCERGGPRAAETAALPATWDGRLSELNSIFGDTSFQAARTRRVLAEIPAYVLTASDTAASAPQVGYDKPKSVWELQHLQMASNFRFGWQRTVFSSHLMQNDRPEIIAAAALAMIDAARAGKAPAPLEASETEATDEPAFADPSR